MPSSCQLKGGRKKRNHRRQTHKKVNKSKHLVAYGKIYADWCGFCITLKPEWEKVEKALLPIPSTNIESANKDSLIDAFNRKYVSNLPKSVGFPTIFKLSKHGGNVEIYNGERNAPSMIAWLKSYNANKHTNVFQNKTQKRKKLFGLF